LPGAVAHPVGEQRHHAGRLVGAGVGQADAADGAQQVHRLDVAAHRPGRDGGLDQPGDHLAHALLGQRDHVRVGLRGLRGLGVGDRLLERGRHPPLAADDALGSSCVDGFGTRRSGEADKAVMGASRTGS